MSKINTKSMFDAIKTSLTSDKESGGGNGLYKEVLKFVPGNSYQVRLVPNPNAPKETIFHYYNHAWTSNSTGKFITAMCPTTFGDTCPIDSYYLKTYRTGTEAEKSAAAMLSRKEGWLVNVYVISDPTTPENEGKVKILRYGKELTKIIESALTGDDSGEFGVEKIFDVANGATLRIKCESRTGANKNAKQYVTYASSKFLTPNNLGLSDAQIEEIHNSVHDLKSLNKQTTSAEMQRLLDEHFFNLTTGSSVDPDDEYSSIRNEKPDTVIRRSSQEIESVFSESSSKSSSKNDVNETDETTDEALKKLLADL